MKFWWPKQSDEGFGLVGAMVAVAILGIVTVTLLGMMGNLKDLTSHVNTDKQAADVARYVQNLLTEPQICNNALRASAFTGHTLPPDVVWTPGTTANIDHIEINNGVSGVSTLAAKAGSYLTPIDPSTGSPRTQGLMLTSIQLRSPNPALGETTPWAGASQITRKSKTTHYNAYPAKLVMRFQQNPAPIAGIFSDKVIDVNVAVPTSGASVVSFCYQPQEVKNIQFVCGPTTLYPGNPDCPALPVAGHFYWYWGNVPVGCSAIYYIQGTDALGKPMCACRISCVTPKAARMDPFAP